MNSKDILKRIAGQFGYRIINDTSDVTLKRMLGLYDELRVKPQDFLRWDHSLANLASASHLRTLFAELNPEVLIDVGANRGQFAISARALGFKGKIVSFEPQRGLYGTLKTLANKDGNWVVYPYGLGDKREELELSIYADDTFSSVLSLSDKAVEKFGDLVSVTATEMIEIRTLDEVMSAEHLNTGSRIFLKSDTQGNELNVLLGAAETLSNAIAVLVEAAVDPLYVGAAHYFSLNEVLLGHGFLQAGMFPIGFDKRRHTLIELDCFYIRQSKCDLAEQAGATSV